MRSLKAYHLVAFIAIAVTFAVTSSRRQITNYCNNTTNPCNNNICYGVLNNSAIANELQCNAFFHCWHGLPVPNTCPRGQWFNNETAFCDSSENEDCPQAGGGGGGGGDGGSGDNDGNSTDSSSLENSGENDNDNGTAWKCPPKGIHFFPHRDYCDKYIMCHSGYPILLHCAEGLYYDRELETCNFPELAECILAVCPEEDDPENIVYVPSDVDCERYYICINGEAEEHFCAPDIHWNAEANQCDYPENANCTIKEKEPENDLPQPHEIECELDDGIFFVPHPRSCEHYFICVNGESTLWPCADDLQFDPINNWCTDQEVVCVLEETKVADNEEININVVYEEHNSDRSQDEIHINYEKSDENQIFKYSLETLLSLN